MESQISPVSIEERVDALQDAADVKPVETPAPETKPEAKPIEPVTEPKPETKPEVKPEPKVEAKAEEKPVEKKQPNDPAELRRWATKAAQEAAAARKEVEQLKAAFAKLTKKPVDYEALAKDPEAIKKQMEIERQEAVAEMQQQLNEANNRAVMNETMVERAKREQDTVNYPRWKKLFPLIQTLALNGDGRINWSLPPSESLDEAYALADQLVPAEEPVPAVEVKPAPQTAPVKSQAEIDAEVQAKIVEAEKRGFERAQEAIRAEQNGAGLGSAGKSGRRDANVSREAYFEMPLEKLKAAIVNRQ